MTKWLYGGEPIESYTKEELIDIVIELSQMMTEQTNRSIEMLDNL